MVYYELGTYTLIICQRQGNKYVKSLSLLSLPVRTVHHIPWRFLGYLRKVCSNSTYYYARSIYIFAYILHWDSVRSFFNNTHQTCLTSMNISKQCHEFRNRFIFVILSKILVYYTNLIFFFLMFYYNSNFDWNQSLYYTYMI